MLNVYLPHDYSESGTPFIALWDLAAYTNAGPGHLNWRNHGENLVQRLDRLIGQQKMPSSVVVIPDCYTYLGGNQYVNSPAVGRYADYLVEELVPWVSERFNLVPDRRGRGLFGKSSGGFGAIYHAIHYPDTWGAAASHAGDVGFDLVYPPEFPVTCNVLAEHGGDALSFIHGFWRKNRPSGRDYSALMILAMAASYDPDPEDPSRIRLPFDLRTCARDAGRWDRWLAFDPLNMIERGHGALARLHALWLDVGFRDQYHVHYGARRLVDRLRTLGVDFHYEEFDGTHSSIDWRLDHSLPFLAEALKTASERSY
jgi:S-formylglutathione hydrolase FrmB